MSFCNCPFVSVKIVMHVCNDRDANKVIEKSAQTQTTTLAVKINLSCTYQKDDGSFRADEICIAGTVGPIF